MSHDSTRLIWLDLEMTGLNPDVNTIIEIATVVTDSDLRFIAEGPVLAIHQDREIMASMDAWNLNQHQHSGLTDRVARSQISLAQAEQDTLIFLQQQVPPQTSPMCGNSICLDRQFLRRYMPTLEKYFHYRNLDVSTLKELVQRWLPHLEKFTKESNHLALDDVYDSIAELNYYRQQLFRLETH